MTAESRELAKTQLRPAHPCCPPQTPHNPGDGLSRSNSPSILRSDLLVLWSDHAAFDTTMLRSEHRRLSSSRLSTGGTTQPTNPSPPVACRPTHPGLTVLLVQVSDGAGDNVDGPVSRHSRAPRGGHAGAARNGGQPRLVGRRGVGLQADRTRRIPLTTRPSAGPRRRPDGILLVQMRPNTPALDLEALLIIAHATCLMRTRFKDLS